MLYSQLSEFSIKMKISNQMNVGILALSKIILFFFWKDPWKIVWFAQIGWCPPLQKQTKTQYGLYLLGLEMVFKKLVIN